MRTTFLVSMISLLLMVSVASAETHQEEVTLKLSDDFLQTACSVPVWKGKSVLWNGVLDARPDRAVGQQLSKKGKEIVEVEAQPPLDRVVETSLKGLFQSCGLNLVSAAPYDILMSVRIEEFFAGTEKKFVTGKAMAKSRLKFLLKNQYGTAEKSVDVGYEMESKKIRQSDLKQLESTLNELLTLTLKEVPKNDDLKGLNL